MRSCFLLATLPLLLSVCSAADLVCTQYHCDEKVETTMDATNCGQFFQKNNTAYYNSSCKTDYYCPIISAQVGTEDRTVQCTKNPGPPAALTVYPGEKCGTKLNRECISSVKCSNDICVGSPAGDACTNDNTCDIGLYCDTTCKKLVEMGAACTKDEMCPMNAFCNNLKSGTAPAGTCVQMYSIKTGDPVEYCDANHGNKLCETNVCYNSAATGQPVANKCMAQVGTDGTLPVTCTSNSDCKTKTDATSKVSYPGVCSCGYNKAGNAYCSLYIGDSIVNQSWELTQAFFQSNTWATKCSTARRGRTLNYNFQICMMDWYGSKNYLKWAYYNSYANNYGSIQGNDDCIKKWVTGGYWQSKKAYDNEDGAWGLLLSLGLVFIFN